MRYGTRLLVLAMLGALFACGGDPEPTAATISREQFIATNVALRTLTDQAEEDGEDEEDAAVARRDSILQEHGVTEADLRDFITAWTGRTRELAGIWDEIHRRLEKTMEGGLEPEWEEEDYGEEDDLPEFEDEIVDADTLGRPAPARPLPPERPRRTPDRLQVEIQ